MDEVRRDSHSGTVGILTTEHGRFSRFWLAMISEHMPVQTKLVVKMSLNIAEARNEVIAEAEGDWVWFMDDDHTFSPELLRKLLERNVDIVQPLVLGRYAPFSPVMMGPKTPGGNEHYRYALTPEEAGTGLKPVHVVGCAGMLVRRRVWEAMEPPWFTTGSLAPDVLSEDIGFCNRATELGFSVYTDLDNPMGHLNIGEVWPHRMPDGSWATKLIFGNHTCLLPPAAPRMKIDTATGEVVETLEEEPHAD